MNETISKRLMFSILAVFGITHALIDAACAGVIFGGQYFDKTNLKYFAFIVILYDILAFGLQAPLGIVVDKFHLPTASSLLGCILVGISVIIFRYPFAAICFAGVGNALFHIGGGVFALNLKLGKAAPAGIYVAPGAMGLMLGTLIGKIGAFRRWPFLVLLLIAMILIFVVDKPIVNYEPDITINNDKLELAVWLIFVSIAMRSLIGFVLDFSWKTNITLLISLTSAVVLGKALGGVLADKLGWTRVSVIGLIISAPLLASGEYNFLLGIAGMFLFNVTMPVTLAAISNMFPGKAGFSFGLTTLALLIGALPGFTSIKVVLFKWWTAIAIILLMSYILYKGLKIQVLQGGIKSNKIKGEEIYDG